MRPDFDELVGADLDQAERARLERVHELLVAAGPPPEPRASHVELPARQRRRGALLALAAALAVAAFSLGAALVDGSTSRTLDYEETLVGTAEAPAAQASLLVFDIDDAGNWPLELRVEGLAPAAGGRPFELWLTRDGELAALCGSFLTSPDGSAVVPMNAPYRFDEFDDWIVVERGTTTPLLARA